MQLHELSEQLQQLYAEAGKSVVGVVARRGHSASGFAFGPRLILTVEHALARADTATVILPDGRDLEARVLGRDAGSDLALLETEEEHDLPQLEWADDTAVGAIVLAVARSDEADLGASLGALSARTGPWRTWRGGRLEAFVQPDLSLYNGYSGGPLVDTYGRLIGLNTSALSRSGPITLGRETLERVVEALQKPAEERAYLGVGLQSVRLKDSGGAIVVSLEEGSPAERDGVLLGDILVELDGASIEGVESAYDAIGALRAGQSTSSAWLRAGERVERELTPGTRASCD